MPVVKLCPTCYKNREQNPTLIYDYTGTNQEHCLTCGGKLEVLEKPANPVQKICRKCNEGFLQPAGVDTYCHKCGSKLEPAESRPQSELATHSDTISATLTQNPYKVSRAFREAQSTAAIAQEKLAEKTAEVLQSEREVRRLTEALNILQGEAVKLLESTTYDMLSSTRFGWQVLHKFLELWKDECPCNQCKAKRNFGVKPDPRGIYWEEVANHFPHRARACVRRLNELAKRHTEPCNSKNPENRGYCSKELYGLEEPPLRWQTQGWYYPNPEFKEAA